MVLMVLFGCRDEQAGPKPKRQARQIRALESAPRLSFQSGATWAGGAIVYLGANMEPPSPQAGEEVRLHHYFSARSPVQGQWGFFVHLVDEASGQQVANLDHEFQDGAAPVSSWPSGKIIEDVHKFVMPRADGPLRLYLGLWNDSGRLPVDTAALSDGQARVKGPRFEVAGRALPEYAVARAKTPPNIDGRLDDAAWQTAVEQPLVRSFDGGPISRKTTFRMVYDDAFIYVAFRAEDPDIWGSLKNKDDAIYNEDVVEVFFDADGDGQTYNELQVSPHNVNFDASFVARRSDLATAMKWESGMQSAVFVKGTLDDNSDVDEYWTAEMKIPIAKLTGVPHIPPQPQERWRFNAYRLEHIARRTNIEGQAFSPLFVGDFHALPRFGWLVFQ